MIYTIFFLLWWIIFLSGGAYWKTSIIKNYLLFISVWFYLSCKLLQYKKYLFFYFNRKLPFICLNMKFIVNLVQPVLLNYKQRRCQTFASRSYFWQNLFYQTFCVCNRYEIYSNFKLKQSSGILVWLGCAKQMIFTPECFRSSLKFY